MFLMKFCLRRTGVLLAAGLLAGLAPGAAQAKDRLVIAVVGDSLADGVWAGAHQTLRRDRRYRVLREAVVSSGFTHYDMAGHLAKVIGRRSPAGAIVMAGTNDQQRMVRPRITYNTEAWWDEYARRVGAYMAALRKSGVPAVWVSLPNMRDKQAARGAFRLNEVYEAAAREYGVTFLSIWNLTSDDNGKYTAFGPDTDGRTRRLRADDGVHFTPIGYRIIAQRALAALYAENPGLNPENAHSGTRANAQ